MSDGCVFAAQALLGHMGVPQTLVTETTSDACCDWQVQDHSRSGKLRLGSGCFLSSGLESCILIFLSCGDDFLDVVPGSVFPGAVRVQLPRSERVGGVQLLVDVDSYRRKVSHSKSSVSKKAG